MIINHDSIPHLNSQRLGSDFLHPACLAALTLTRTGDCWGGLAFRSVRFVPLLEFIKPLLCAAKVFIHVNTQSGARIYSQYWSM